VLCSGSVGLTPLSGVLPLQSFVGSIPTLPWLLMSNP
jgi:hypothetical protein